MIYDAIIIGGGAAGLFCAIEAGKRKLKVMVVEHNAEVGRKIIISGGGRCNFTNIDTRAENFISQNPHFCKSALSRYTPKDFVDLVKKHKIDYYEKKLGQLFCRESSRQIVDMLLSECRKSRVTIKTGCAVDSVTKNERFAIETNHGRFQAKNLVVACGGLSFPKIGASDMGYRIARQFKLKIVETRPSLVALVLDGKDFSRLAGLSVDAVVTAGKQSFRENILFTHRGMSGPAILQVSNYWRRSETVSFQFAPDTDVVKQLSENAKSRRNLSNFLAEFLPQRFADEFAVREFENKPLYQMNVHELESVVERLNDWQLKFRETEGYDRAEVTLGGVSTDELSSQTMEAKKVPGLYFIGEVVDVTGWLGGYNFQWAWSSAYATGTSIRN
ncbi:MAG: NAD(P)/FAD-dependent oxidoreductase [Acidobacteriota bacterium]